MSIETITRAGYGLTVAGDPDILDNRPIVAIVGSRAATVYGETVATELAANLARTGALILSGGAYGIDAAAHRGTIAVGGKTAAVLACGVDVLYPRGNSALFARIVDEGALLSNYSLGTPPSRERFLARNRVIAALADIVVVVESSGQSGSMSTARHARDLGTPLAAVPGPVTSATSVGTNTLIREGAHLVTCAEDVLAVIGR